MIEFEVLQREYPELVRAALYSGVSKNDVEKLTFSGPVLLKIIEHLVSSNRDLVNRVASLDGQVHKLAEILRDVRSDKMQAQNNWASTRWKWDSL